MNKYLRKNFFILVTCLAVMGFLATDMSIAQSNAHSCTCNGEITQPTQKSVVVTSKDDVF